MTMMIWLTCELYLDRWDDAAHLSTLPGQVIRLTCELYLDRWHSDDDTAHLWTLPGQV